MSIRVLFICHGNICRSTMAQFVLQNLVNRAGYTDNFYIDSMATSTEEIGNGPHHGTVAKLRQVGVPVLEHYAKQVRKSDYRNFDHIIGMDQWNYRNMMRIFGKDPEQKVSLLLDFTDRPGEIADPWYTGNFDETYRDVLDGCEGFLAYLRKQGKL